MQSCSENMWKMDSKHAANAKYVILIELVYQNTNFYFNVFLLFSIVCPYTRIWKNRPCGESLKGRKETVMFINSEDRTFTAVILLEYMYMCLKYYAINLRYHIHTNYCPWKWNLKVIIQYIFQGLNFVGDKTSRQLYTNMYTCLAGFWKIQWKFKGNFFKNSFSQELQMV